MGFNGNFDSIFIGMISSKIVGMIVGIGLQCRRDMRAIASSMSPHVSLQQGPAPIFSAATAGGITTAHTVSAAAKTLPTTPTRER